MISRLIMMGAWLQVYMHVHAQTETVPEALWMLPGITYEFRSSAKLSAQYGHLLPTGLNAIYLQGFVPLSKNLILNPGYLGLLGPGQYPEYGFINGYVARFKPAGFVIEQRSLLWNRLRSNARDLHFYRGRLFVSKPFQLKRFFLNAYVFDEVSYFLNDKRWSRNRIATGISAGVRMAKLDCFYALQSDTPRNKTNLFVVIATFQLPDKNN